MLLLLFSFAAKNYVYPSNAPLKSETHGGDDVGVFALGPWSHLFTGVYEQNIIPHVMAYASCIGNGLSACWLPQHQQPQQPGTDSSGSGTSSNTVRTTSSGNKKVDTSVTIFHWQDLVFDNTQMTRWGIDMINLLTWRRQSKNERETESERKTWMV